MKDLARTDPVEVRFSSQPATAQPIQWQLLASVTNSGVIAYELQRVPRRSYTQHLSSLVGVSTTTLPMKAYDGWQTDVLAWVANHRLGTHTVYEIERVL